MIPGLTKEFVEMSLPVYSFGGEILMLLITVASVICAFAAYRHQKRRAKKERACELAKDYAEKLKRFGQLTYVYDATGYSDLVKKAFSLDKMVYFSRKEMERLLKDAKISEKEIDSKIDDANPEIFLTYGRFDLSLIDDLDRYNEQYGGIVSGSGAAEYKREKELKDKFKRDATTLRNEMEHFCMCCRYGLADEKVLYQSLHQTFFSFVWSMYYEISRLNDSSEDRYFTNIIYLYGVWKKRFDKARKKAENRRRKRERAEARMVYQGSKV